MSQESTSTIDGEMPLVNAKTNQVVQSFILQYKGPGGQHLCLREKTFSTIEQAFSHKDLAGKVLEKKEDPKRAYYYRLLMEAEMNEDSDDDDMSEWSDEDENPGASHEQVGNPSGRRSDPTTTSGMKHAGPSPEVAPFVTKTATGFCLGPIPGVKQLNRQQQAKLREDRAKEAQEFYMAQKKKNDLREAKKYFAEARGLLVSRSELRAALEKNTQFPAVVETKARFGPACFIGAVQYRKKLFSWAPAPPSVSSLEQPISTGKTMKKPSKPAVVSVNKMVQKERKRGGSPYRGEKMKALRQRIREKEMQNVFGALFDDE
ncbi:unnamed protein product [Amoebophrya sp. A120]|nr:unnamed protein product [Amoebophrya sp. A120]|eukprot:GSA120T00003999001.1